MGNGYGQVRRKGKTRLLHRVTYCEANNCSLESIDGLLVRHKCDTPSCYEPTHLELGSHSDNQLDRRRDDKKHWKVSYSDVAGIRKMLAEGARQKDIAKAYGITQPMVSRIKTGKAWYQDEY